MSWSTSPTGTSNYFDFGNTSYPYEFSDSVGTGDSAFVNYLEPSTTYDFEIQALKSCWIGGVYTGSFTTPSDSVTTFSGIVTDPNNGQPPSQMPVVAYCVLYPPSQSQPGWTLALTSSTGTYSMPTPQWFNLHTSQWQSCSNGGGGYTVAFVNSENFALGTVSLVNPFWTGHWNETVVTWGPQVVNFNVSTNFLSPYVPQVLDFSNAPAGYGKISYQATFKTSETLQHDWSVSGGAVAEVGASGSTAVTQTIYSGIGPYSDAGTLDWGATFQYTTGSVLFNSIYRTWNITSIDLFHPNTDGFASQYGVSPPNDYLVPGQLPKDAYYLLDSNGLPLQNRLTPAGEGYLGDVQTSTTVATSSGFSIGFSLSVGLPGGPSVDFNAQTGWTQTTSTSSGSDLQWSIGGTQAACYDVFGQGGSPSAYPVTNADMIGIYYWAPVNGICSGG